MMKFREDDQVKVVDGGGGGGKAVGGGGDLQQQDDGKGCEGGRRTSVDVMVGAENIHHGKLGVATQ